VRLVDEAGGIIVPSAMMAIGAEIPRGPVDMPEKYTPNMAPNGHQRLIIVGDTNQLEPVVKSAFINKERDGVNLPVNPFAHQLGQSLLHHVEKIAKHPGIYLSTVFRFVHRFFEPVAKVFHARDAVREVPPHLLPQKQYWYGMQQWGVHEMGLRTLTADEPRPIFVSITGTVCIQQEGPRRSRCNPQQWE
jgi:hypothetical protein